MATEKKSEKISSGVNGGKRPGAGRKAGSPNKKTAETVRKIEESGITPLEYLLSVMRDPASEEKDRMTAAIAAAPYSHAKLSSIELNANVTTHEDSLDDLA